MRRYLLVMAIAASAVVAVMTTSAPAEADCTNSGSASEDSFLTGAHCAVEPEDSGGSVDLVTDDPDILATDHVPSCADFDLESANGITCNVKLPGCASDETKYDVRVKYAVGSDIYPEGGWVNTGPQCFGPVDGGSPPERTVGPGDVLDALHRTGLPKAELQTQPGFDSGKTLVNFDTNFYTDVEPVTETFTLLGQRVQVEATPANYTWHFDSGRADQTRTTSTPGEPYPDLEITYAYDDAHVTVHPSVDVTYSARFSVNGGAWQAIPATVTIDGDPVSRYVAEATAMLSDMR